MPNDPAEYACRLYTALHHVDATGFGRLLVEAPPTRSAWLAVNDRLRRVQTRELLTPKIPLYSEAPIGAASVSM